MSEHKHVQFASMNGRTSPVIVYLPVQAGSSQLIYRGEICKLRSLSDYAGHPVVPATADDSGFIPVIAWEAQTANDTARKIAFALPRPGDFFKFDLNTESTVQLGTQLEIYDSQTLKTGSSNVVAVSFDVDQYLDNDGNGIAESDVWVQFCHVADAGLNQFPMVGIPATVSVLNNLGHAISDPGDGEAIGGSISGYVAIDIGDTAETGSVDAPTRAGLELLLSAKTVGSGSRALTFPAAIDGTNDVATFDAASECLRVMSVQTGASTFAWRLVCNVGSTLSES